MRGNTTLCLLAYSKVCNALKCRLFGNEILKIFWGGSAPLPDPTPIERGTPLPHHPLDVSKILAMPLQIVDSYSPGGAHMRYASLPKLHLYLFSHFYRAHQCTGPTYRDTQTQRMIHRLHVASRHTLHRNSDILHCLQWWRCGLVTHNEL